jgi:WD40 repeat protein/TPR repeat protein
VRERLRIFVSSPGDVKSAREIAALTIECLAQDYARLLIVEPYLWEFEAMVASGHFQDSIEPPSAFDVVVLILWSRLGTQLPERTAIREYRGIDGRTPLTGTEWEFEEAMQAAKQTGAPDLLVYRNLSPAPFDTHDPGRFEQQSLQLKALNGFWERHFANQGMFIGAYTSFTRDAEFAAALESHLRKLIDRRIAALGVGTGDNTTAKAWMQGPFRGLEAYEFEHAPIFFGQDEALAKAMLQLTANAEAGSPFLLVLGASGSGKSSLVKAGIVPKFFVPRRIPGTAFLRRVIFRPSDAQDGEDLFGALARRLTTQASEQEGLSELLVHGQSIASLSAHLRNATAAPAYPIETALGQLTAQARQSGRMLEYETAKLVLVVDQLEELFTVERISLGERVQFIELLAGLVRSGLIWVVATMRKDFWHRADETPELVRLSEGNGRLELLPPLPSQLSQMIRRPAEAAGIHFEMHGTSNVPLNEVISEEVAREPGALPLLSYLLDQLYRIDVLETHGSTLTYVTYERLGKLEGAVATQAEAVLERCLPEDRAALGSVLFSLVDMGPAEGNVDRAIARRVPLSTFTPGSPQRRLIEALLDPDARLLVSGTEKGGSPTIRVAHEALITRWAQARDFVQSNVEALKIRHRIEDRYALWRGLEAETHGTERADTSTFGFGWFASWRTRFGRETGLLTDIDLTDGRRLLKEHRTDTEPHLVSYIERSVADNQRTRTRTVRVLAVVATVVSILAIVASAAGWIASKRQHEAEYQSAERLKAQVRLLTDASAQKLKNRDVAVAQGIILEILTNARFAETRTPAVTNVFQEVRSADSNIAVLYGHVDRLRSAAYSPDGTRVVTASWDNTARIWDARSGVQLAVLSGHHDTVACAVYSPDGKNIVTTSKDKTARIWDARTNVQLAVLSGHMSAVISAAYSPDGTRIVTASNDKTARVWDARSGVQLSVLSGHTDLVYDASYSPDGSHIVTASWDKTARVWDARSGAQVVVISGHSDGVNSAAYSPDGSRIVTAALDKTARIWDARTGVQVALLLGHSNFVFSAAYSPDGSRIVTASYDKTARIYDADGTPVAVLSGHTDQVNSAAYSPDGSRIVTASLDKTARIWDSHAGSELAVLNGHSAPVIWAAFSPDGTRVVTASRDKTARVQDARTGAQLLVLFGHRGVVYSAAYSPDGNRIVTASDDNTARVWDAQTGAHLATLAGHTDGLNHADYSPDGTRIVTASNDRTARIWDARTGAPLAVLAGHATLVVDAAYSPDGGRIATASLDKTARIWDARTGALLFVLSGHNALVSSVSFSPNGNRIVTASSDNSARIWDAHDGAQLAVLLGHDDEVNTASYSPDGTRIVTSSTDKTARIWEAATGTPLAVLSGHRDALNSAVYSPDGAHIVTSADDRTARVWDANVPATVPAQITWDSAAEIDPLSAADRTQLGLSDDSSRRNWSPKAHACDQAAAAFYDPDRQAPGVIQSDINADIANDSCAAEIARPGYSARSDYHMGRALRAKHDMKGARRHFELAAAAKYRAANVDLAVLLQDSPEVMIDPIRVISLYETAWEEGVPIAAYQLGHHYEVSVPSAASSPQSRLQPDLAKAWSWYQKGADAGEPNALARFAERDERDALLENDPAKRNALLLHAFTYYAAAAERAHDEDWPDDAWKAWRYRRATLARLLAREGMMQQVADAYQTVRDKWAPRPLSLWKSMQAKWHSLHTS